MKKIIILLSILLFYYTLNSQVIGRQEVVGYTKTEQVCGVVYTYCRVDPQRQNIHVYWLYTAGNIAVDRNQRYNFYNHQSRSWNWADTGINVFSIRSGFGSLDYDPITGVAVASTHQGSPIRPAIAKDNTPGEGNFQISQGPSGFQWPLIAVTHNQVPHIAMNDGASTDSLWYTRCQPWNNWSIPIRIPPPAPSPMFPNQNIGASKISNKVIITWEESEPLTGYQQRGYYRLSEDGGTSWQPSTQVPFPPAYGGDTIPSFYIAGLYPIFDHNDNLHIVTQVHPIISGSGYVRPAEIWHYCPANNPSWSRIFRSPDSMATYIGYNAVAACRPSIVQNPTNPNYLYVSWEAFDSLNYEPLTGFLRADIWIAESPNNGLTWQNQQPITIPNTTSKRYPCVGGIVDDSLVLAYMIDSIAGFEAYAQGRATRNPVVVQWVPVPLPGVETEELPTHNAPRIMLDAKPNPFNSFSVIRYSLPVQSKISLEIYDVSGRLVKSLTNIQQQTSNIFSVIWNGKDNNGIEVKSGIYFYTLKTTEKIISGKIIKSR